ncbi:MAG: nuclease [Ignavibacteria bacterium CG_4_8_14_3_um_filter_37_9]|nr:nuclease [Ignavibacteria bacterium]OIO22192.1 MAG: nuclease [Ignavibacteria bacterium CG1_02_37_35]PIP77024.1 MAG: nuclease [Ignavibacteria bacterium CG22_combo_CG10-13_8_21_14_all_37_15]PIS44148.1 MAG: nuclease [Ignavibacteria bacterium CG08_land_8_20_14_0_20_37_9]PIW99433.1 MAG: nuclease [Ignavibacteria bacterium CG_4_8_14_3_um_filter_37_9]PIX93319.1 MAG: nuclease [Ignavibacteria bacterium CG_4_10_14_3_um_filter_37_18]PJC57979.1 MAG: nuclease [Ignavibacteria bacterium CG_4_9_14_0_2_um_fi
MELQLFQYNAFVTAVYDGDTCTVDIDLGLHTWIKNEKIRLFGINAPELRGKERPQGLLSRDFLRGLILNKEITLRTIKDAREKYGRYLGEIWVTTAKGTFVNVNDELVKKGFAVYKEY